MKIIFSDFDGTLTEKRMLGPKFFDVLDLCQKNSAEFILVSGRSVSWGHFFLTHFPMEVAIMEGGGVILLSDNKGQIREDILLREDELFSLDEVTVKLMSKFPQCPLSADSFGRKTDRALEFIDQDPSMMDEIMAFFREEQVEFSMSDVHLNFWVGDVSKYRAVEKFMKRYRENVSFSDIMYFGDAPNDESMFKNMLHSVGVSNIEKYLERLVYKPKVILNGEKNRSANGVYNYLKKEIFKNQKK